MNRRIFVLALGLGVAAFVAPRVALAEDHLAEAISHTKEAIDHGKQGHADVLVTHAEAALKHAEAAEKAKKNEHTKEGITHLKASIADEKNKFIRGQLTNIKDRLKKAIPGMEVADVVFRKKSEPINQMQIGQYLEQKLTPALSEEAPQRAATFAGALRDAPGTIKRATGAPRFENLSKALTQKQLEAVNEVRDELARSARFEAMGRFGARAQPGAGELGEAAIKREVGGNIPGILERGVFIVRALIYRVGGHMDRKLAAEVAAEMLNPPQVAESLRQAQLRAARNAMVATAIHKRIVPALAVTAAQGQARMQQDLQEQR